MAVVGGFDLHRGQLTFDYVDTGTGESRRGRICPADRESLRGWLRRFDGVPDVEFAVEGCTGWRYVAGELQRAGITAHLAEPAETAGLRGSKRRAKTDWADARHLRDLLLDGRIPESWIPPAHVLEARALVRLYKDLPKSAPAGSSGPVPRCFIRASRWCPSSAPQPGGSAWRRPG
jgi:transposase